MVFKREVIVKDTEEEKLLELYNKYDILQKLAYILVSIYYFLRFSNL
jgi:hypothetical protein